MTPWWRCSQGRRSGPWTMDLTSRLWARAFWYFVEWSWLAQSEYDAADNVALHGGSIGGCVNSEPRLHP